MSEEEIIEQLKEKLRIAQEAMRIASKVCDKLQSLGEIDCRVRRIECHDDDFDPWFARDILDRALETIRK